MHNFSTSYMRETGGQDYFERLMAAFAGRALTTSPSTGRTTTCG